MAVLGGCVDEPVDESDAQFSINMSATEGKRVLELVNYPGTTFAILDEAVGLDSRAAAGIVAHRDGADGKVLTADDDRFEDVAEIDQIAYVGDVALTRLLEYSAAHPLTAGELVETVAFMGWQVEAVVWGVNHATLAELDNDAGLDTRAANNLIAGRPYTSVTAIGGASYVGVTALVALRDRAPLWWTARGTGGGGGTTGGLAGTFDGVTFDEATARIALSITNLATREQMVAHGVYAPAAAAIVGNRPYASLAQVAAVSGVATSTMRGLHTYASSGAWVPPGDRPCTLSLSARADATTADFTELLSLATTLDYPFGDARALQIDACNDLSSAATQAAVTELLRTTPLIDWGYTDNTRPGIASFNAGGARFIAHVQAGYDRIDERVADGRWAPANADESALLASLPQLVSTLTSAPAARPGDFAEVAMKIDNEECSSYASALVERATGRIWVMHRFPAC